ncbi:LysE family translocator [Marinomonas mediterranea]|uniref:LysE family translocator n=1 Tax=Marinomonas mediterranea TaxID=119864 RepID=UPI00234BD851|nr:LysE family translocator [Marinomonas mediterranea]
MMALDTWFTFAFASLALALLPGPTILAVVSYSLSHGKRVSLILVSAVALGDATALFASLVGLGALLSTSAMLFTVVKVIGAVYLLFLGFRMITSRGTIGVNDDAILQRSRRKLFMNTYFITALNPKGIIFFIAFLPQFVIQNGESSSTYAQLWILAVTFVVIASSICAAYALLASSARRLFTSKKVSRRVDIFGGFFMVVAGVWAMFSRRAAIS